MKIALLGNCQLLQIGGLLKAFFQQNDLPHEVVWHTPIFSLGDQSADIVSIFNALDQADVIYGQYHEKRWNTFGTDNLSKYFNIKVVPTLDSPASFPQMNYFSKGSLCLGLYTVDFRMLDLYLAGISVEHLPGIYSKAILDERKRDNAIRNTASKYKSLFNRGKTIFDYSDFYLQAMAQPQDPFFVHNHPNNAQLQWLTNEILRDAGIPLAINLEKLPELLTDTIVPSLNLESVDRYRIRGTEVGLRTAAKINYAFFATYEREFLEQELARSNYKAMCTSLV